MEEKGTLHLLPNLLFKEASPEESFSKTLFEIVPTLDGLIAESDRAGRAFLSHFDLGRATHEVPLAVVNKKTASKDLDFYLEPMDSGENWGYVSDAGLPCIADPGSELVARARRKKIPVCAHPGPSALIMALMLAGLPGKSFAFRGYLPVEPKARKLALRRYEKESSQERSVQVFIEAPFRNEATLNEMVNSLKHDTLLGVAIDLTAPSQEVWVKRIEQYQASPLPKVQKRPTVFLLFSHRK